MGAKMENLDELVKYFSVFVLYLFLNFMYEMLLRIFMMSYDDDVESTFMRNSNSIMLLSSNFCYLTFAFVERLPLCCVLCVSEEGRASKVWSA